MPARFFPAPARRLVPRAVTALSVLLFVFRAVILTLCQCERPFWRAQASRVILDVVVGLAVHDADQVNDAVLEGVEKQIPAVARGMIHFRSRPASAAFSVS